jgi:hypothetical protein
MNWLDWCELAAKANEMPECQTNELRSKLLLFAALSVKIPARAVALKRHDAFWHHVDDSFLRQVTYF